MKNLLKGLPKERQLDYSKTFSQQSKNVHENLIPELKRMMMGYYNPSVTQLVLLKKSDLIGFDLNLIYQI